MAEILVLTSQIPVPVQATGTSLRLNPVLRHLAQSHAVDLIPLAESRPDADRLAREAEGFCRRVTPASRKPLGGLRRVSRTIQGMAHPGRPPWELIDPFSKELVAAVASMMSERRYDVLLTVGQVADVTCQLRRRGVLPPRTVVDWIDAPSLLHERKARALSPPLAALARRRVRRLVDWQRRVNEWVDAAIYIADVDREHAAATGNPRVHVIPNGVLRRGRHFERVSGKRASIGFLGNMAYSPNIHAALRLYHRVFRPLVAERPELALKIIGRDPDPRLLELAGPNVELTGEVDSIWPHLADVDIMVFPMEFGGGLQNKVLESAEAGCAIVSTHVGAAGIGAEGLGSIIVEDTDEGIVRAVRQLLDDPSALADAKQRSAHLRTIFDWEQILPRFSEVVLGR